MEDITVKFFIEGVVLLASFVAAMKVLLKPLKKAKLMDDKLNKHSERIDQIIQQQEELNAQISQLIKFQKIQCKSEINLINHMIDGNGVEEMKKSRQEFMDLTINNLA